MDLYWVCDDNVRKTIQGAHKNMFYVPFPSNENKQSQRFATFDNSKYSQILLDINGLTVSNFESYLLLQNGNLIMLPALPNAGKGVAIKLVSKELYKSTLTDETITKLSCAGNPDDNSMSGIKRTVPKTTASCTKHDISSRSKKGTNVLRHPQSSKIPSQAEFTRITRYQNIQSSINQPEYRSLWANRRSRKCQKNPLFDRRSWEPQLSRKGRSLTAKHQFTKENI